MLTAADLRAQTSKHLAQMAKQNGVPGWHSMRKEQLVKAILKYAKRQAQAKSGKPAITRVSSRDQNRKNTNRAGTSANAAHGSQNNGVKSNGVKSNGAKSNGAKTKKTKSVSNPRVANRIRKERLKLESMKNLAGKTEVVAPKKDRIILIVRDPYWVQAYWEITAASMKRVKVALGELWHDAKPVLRVIESGPADSTSTVEQIAREIEIHGGVNNWFIDVPNPPKAYRVAIGYLVNTGRFHLIAKSNQVSTPVPGSNEEFDLNWDDIANNYEKMYSQSCSANGHNESDDLKKVFEEKLRRPMSTSLFAQFAGPQTGIHDLRFSVDAEMIVFGRTTPGSAITMAGEPVRIDSDGTFAVRLPMPDRRQVLPIVARSRDGCQQKTTVLAVERNTKEMEPITRDHNVT